MLLSGDPGTGKTLAAEVIAAELGLNLYRVNPAKVVSKFVGETEKNLNEILAQAKSTHAILFFDEADALFSTRVAKVETANDRFVNMETNFLLAATRALRGHRHLGDQPRDLDRSGVQAAHRLSCRRPVSQAGRPRAHLAHADAVARARRQDRLRAARQDLRAVGRPHQERDLARRLHRRAARAVASTTTYWPRPPRKSAPPRASCSSTSADVASRPKETQKH